MLGLSDESRAILGGVHLKSVYTKKTKELIDTVEAVGLL